LVGSSFPLQSHFSVLFLLSLCMIAMFPELLLQPVETLRPHQAADGIGMSFRIRTRL